MKVRLTEPKLVDRRPDGPSGRLLTTWRGEFEGDPDRWWREAFAMWAREELRGVCDFRITSEGYEFECGEDQIEDVMGKLAAAAKRAGPTAGRSRAKHTDHQDTRALFLKVEVAKREMLAKAEAAKQKTGKGKLQERMANKFKNLEQ